MYRVASTVKHDGYRLLSMPTRGTIALMDVYVQTTRNLNHTITSHMREFETLNMLVDELLQDSRIRLIFVKHFHTYDPKY